MAGAMVVPSSDRWRRNPSQSQLTDVNSVEIQSFGPMKEKWHHIKLEMKQWENNRIEIERKKERKKGRKKERKEGRKEGRKKERKKRNNANIAQPVEVTNQKPASQ